MPISPHPELACPMKIMPSQCDTAFKLSIPAIFAIFQDIAGVNAGEMGVDSNTLYEKCNACWVVVRFRLRFLGRPHMLEEVTAETWPALPAGLRCERSFLLKNAEVLVRGRSEWTMISAETRKLIRPEKTCHPMDLSYREDVALDEPYSRLRDDFTEEEKWAERIVRASDIDFAHHMNNVVYTRMLTDTFPAAFWETHEPDILDLHFVNECHENETVSVYRRKTPEGFAFAVRRETGETALLAYLTLK